MNNILDNTHKKILQTNSTCSWFLVKIVRNRLMWVVRLSIVRDADCAERLDKQDIDCPARHIYCEIAVETDNNIVISQNSSHQKLLQLDIFLSNQTEHEFNCCWIQHYYWVTQKMLRVHQRSEYSISTVFHCYCSVRLWKTKQPASWGKQIVCLSSGMNLLSL